MVHQHSPNAPARGCYRCCFREATKASWASRTAVVDDGVDADGGRDQVAEDRDRLEIEAHHHHHQAHALDRKPVEGDHGDCSAAGIGGEDAAAGSGT